MTDETLEVKAPLEAYLGDSVYAEFDGWGVILETRNGLPDDPSNRIALEPAVLIELVKFAVSHKAIRILDA